MGTANFGPLTNPSGPKAGRMRIREGKLPACGIQLKKQTEKTKKDKADKMRNCAASLWR